MPTKATFVALSLLAAASIAASVEAIREVCAFNSSKVGQDAASLALRKFEPLLADLPAAATLRCIGEAANVDASVPGLVDLLTDRTAQILQEGTCDPVAGIDTQFLQHLADGYLVVHPDGRDHNRDEVRANLLDIWSGHVDGLQLVINRYALAPHLVLRDPPADFVVGDFSPGFDYRVRARQEKLELVRDYGNGVVLFRSGS